ncbi:hypothetical protein K7711_46480 [Nocardia sp. CA2R105]|uniref:hypothetical protein n=1 Tax=Nocardia coffeae TaxID=2873381 RepID=UPI001CA64335|nr:hypothetical protein [Nocardia coffeae]MBY8863979.1 hypothetical protein [Nocardia coffeae]
MVITDIRTKILNRTSPASGGTVVVYPPQGLNDTIKAGLDLDETTPRARTVLDTGDLSTQHLFDTNHTVSLTNGEVATFGIKAMTTQSDVTYDLVIDAIVDGRPTHQEVTNGAQPFHTRAFAAAYDQVLGWSTAADTDTSSWATTDLESATSALCDTSCNAPVPLKPPPPPG